MASSTLFQQVVRKYLVSKIEARPSYYDILKSCRTQRLGWTPWQTTKSRALKVEEWRREAFNFPLFSSELEQLAARLLLKFTTIDRSWNSKVSVWIPPTPRKWLLGLPRCLIRELVHKEDKALPKVLVWLEEQGEFPRAEVLRMYLQEKEKENG